MLFNNTQQTCRWWILIVTIPLLHPPPISFRSLVVFTLSLNWFMTEKYEIIKNYVSRLLALDVHLLPTNGSCVCNRKIFALKLFWLGLFVFHHVHRVYLISVSLFCLFNVAFSGFGLCFSFHWCYFFFFLLWGWIVWHFSPLIVNWPEISPQRNGLLAC